MLQHRNKNQFRLDNIEERPVLFMSHWVLFNVTPTALSAHFCASQKRIMRQ